MGFKQGVQGIEDMYKGLRQNFTCGPVQLLDLSFVSVNKELVEVVLGGGLVVVTPA